MILIMILIKLTIGIIITLIICAYTESISHPPKDTWACVYCDYCGSVRNVIEHAHKYHQAEIDMEDLNETS